MLIWIDILTPKQFFFMGELSKRLEDKGHNIFRTTRQYREVNELIRIYGVNALSIGKHGGASLEGKLAASGKRIEELSHIINRLKPDLSIACASPEAARTAFGLAIPHYTINDSPHSTAVAHLTIPLSLKLFSPSIIPKKVWTRLGANQNNIIQYNALDPIVWLNSFTPNPSVLDELKLDNSKPIVVFRAEETFASYLLDYVSDKESTIIPIISKLIEECNESIQIVALPRYTEQISIIRDAFNNQIIVPNNVIDGQSLLFFSTVFVGAGGTMTTEAALLGVPTISCYPREPTLVEKYLVNKKLVFRVTDSAKATKKITNIIKDFDIIHKIQLARAKSFISEMENPIDIIINSIENNF